MSFFTYNAPYIHLQLSEFVISYFSLRKTVARDKDAQALEPVVGNFDTLGEATSEEKAPLWWEKQHL